MRKLLTLTLILALTATTAYPKAKKTHPKDDTSQAPAPTPEYSIDREGLFNVTKKGDQWFFQLPDSLLDKDILTTTRYISTPTLIGKYGGEAASDNVVFFQLTPDSTLLLRLRLFAVQADSTDAVSRAVTLSNEAPIIASFKVEEHKDGRIRFNATPFLTDDNPLFLSNPDREAFGLGQMVKESSYIEDIKTFPTNTDARLVKTYRSSKNNPAARATGRMTFTLNLSFVLLPEIPMQPRLFDLRVGYFSQVFRRYTDEQQSVGLTRYVARWRLEPRDEDIERMRAGELVEPKKPIVFYIDPATPPQWRKYLIQGVNDWQAAFEQAGFKNAIYALPWPEEGADSLMSMEDARYSVVRYLASETQNAYGPHISDPRTGEILESHIGWYHNILKLLHDWYFVQASSIDEAARKMRFDEELMGRLIRFVVSHEVGHALGLRHNFGSSSTVPVDSLRSPSWLREHGHTPSIMDYARFNYVAQPEDGLTPADLLPRIGDYDRWAIQWGYQPMPDATTPEEDRRLLEPLTLEAQKNRRLWWGDGEGERRDPRRQTEDLGDDAVKASDYGLRNLKREYACLEEWTRDEADLYDESLPDMTNQIAQQYMRYMRHVAKYIGGTFIDWHTRPEGGPLYEPTPLATQKAAFGFICDNLLTEPTWLREPRFVASLYDDPQAVTLPMAREAATLLVAKVDDLNRLYPVWEYLPDVVEATFTEARSSGALSPYREALQQSEVDNLVKAFAARTGAQRGAVKKALDDIARLARAYRGSDPRAKAFYAHLADQIARAVVVK